MQIYSIGHSNHTQEHFIKLLQTEHIEVLVDVRSNPNSRWAVFANKEKIEETLKLSGIKYLYLGDLLGGHPQGEEYINENDGKIDYNVIRDKPFYQKGIQRLVDGLNKFKICIMCSEEDPNHCHRNILIAESLRKLGVKIYHIRGDGRIQSDEELWKEKAGVPDNQSLLPL